MFWTCVNTHKHHNMPTNFPEHLWTFSDECKLLCSTLIRLGHCYHSLGHAGPTHLGLGDTWQSIRTQDENVVYYSGCNEVLFQHLHNLWNIDTGTVGQGMTSGSLFHIVHYSLGDIEAFPSPFTLPHVLPWFYFLFSTTSSELIYKLVVNTYKI